LRFVASVVPVSSFLHPFLFAPVSVLQTVVVPAGAGAVVVFFVPPISTAPFFGFQLGPGLGLELGLGTGPGLGPGIGLGIEN